MPGSTGPPAPEPVDRTIEDQPANGLCEASTWCVTAQAVPDGDSYVFRLRACRSASDSAGTLRFSKEDEADFRVLRNDTEVWRWSDGRRDGTWSHEVIVDRWQCAVWTTRWWGNDGSGAPVPAGTYRLEAFSTSTTLPDVWHARSFAVTP